MQQQKRQAVHSRLKFNLKPIPFSAGKIIFFVILLSLIITITIGIMTGPISLSTISTGLTAAIVDVATLLAVYSFFVKEQATGRQSAGQPPTSSTTPISPDNARNGNVAQDTSANLVSVQLAATQSSSNAVSPSPSNIQSGITAQSTGAKTEQPIFFFNMPLYDIKEFYGHDAARTTLVARTANGGSSSIVGERRVGKTWLLEYLQLAAMTHSKLGLAYRIGRISATHSECKSLKGFAQRALEALKVPQYSQDLGLQPLSQLSRAVRDLKRHGFYPVLSIDEFEGFDNKQEFNGDFFEQLRAMAQDDGLVLVTASKRTVNKLIEGLTGQTSPLFNIMQQILLYPFTEQEARNFVHDKSNIAGFTKKESEFFFNQSKLHNTNGERYWPPLRLQLVGQMLLDGKQSRQGQPLDDQLDNFHYRSEFEKRLDESYQAVVGHTSW